MQPSAQILALFNHCIETTQRHGYSEQPYGACSAAPSVFPLDVIEVLFNQAKREDALLILALIRAILDENINLPLEPLGDLGILPDLFVSLRREYCGLMGRKIRYRSRIPAILFGDIEIPILVFVFVVHY